ncbi:MAG: hypothetical protein CMJ81_11895 [Planctomycetaceae bacterium]|nr:hypothetical protein [Planctomycetaceae bacterium]MBP62694.1 hypothetical protein [Planctomycetaceae bacterium]
MTGLQAWEATCQRVRNHRRAKFICTWAAEFDGFSAFLASKAFQCFCHSLSHLPGKVIPTPAERRLVDTKSPNEIWFIPPETIAFETCSAKMWSLAPQRSDRAPRRPVKEARKTNPSNTGPTSFSVDITPVLQARNDPKPTTLRKAPPDGQTK